MVPANAAGTRFRAANAASAPSLWETICLPRRRDDSAFSSDVSVACRRHNEHERFRSTTLDSKDFDFFLTAGVGGFALVALPAVPLAVPILSWAIAGTGIGMSFSTLSVLALAFAPPGEEGRTSSALQLNDYLVQSAALAAGSVAFAGFAYRDPVTGATLLVIAATLVGALALVPASRLRA